MVVHENFGHADSVEKSALNSRREGIDESHDEFSVGREKCASNNSILLMPLTLVVRLVKRFDPVEILVLFFISELRSNKYCK